MHCRQRSLLYNSVSCSVQPCTIYKVYSTLQTLSSIPNFGFKTIQIRREYRIRFTIDMWKLRNTSKFEFADLHNHSLVLVYIAHRYRQGILWIVVGPYELDTFLRGILCLTNGRTQYIPRTTYVLLLSNVNAEKDIYVKCEYYTR